MLWTDADYLHVIICLFLIFIYVEFGAAASVGLKIEVGLCILSFKARVSKDECSILEFIYLYNYRLRIQQLLICNNENILRHFFKYTRIWYSQQPLK